MLGSVLGSIDSVPEDGLSTPGAAGLAVGLTGLVVAAGALHATRAAIIARATKIRLNMKYPPLRQPTGCRRWLV
jgi:hypothetical protein